METITFTKSRLPWGWLGNMSHFPVFRAGLKFYTTEHLFQALRFNDLDVINGIREIKNPYQAKLFAKSNLDKMVVTPRSDRDIDNMYEVIRLKLDQHPELEQLLLSTGNKLIVEDCSGRKVPDRFWGAVLENGKWVGQNVLGNAWMDIRKERS